MMNGRHAARNQEGHNTFEKKIRENLKIVNVLLYKYRRNSHCKNHQNSIHIFFFVAKKCNGELSFL